MDELRTIDILLANKDRKEPVTVYERARGIIRRTGEPVDDFTGAYTYSKGQVTPLDGDSYSVYENIVAYEWVNNSMLTVWYAADYLSGAEIDAELEKYKCEHADLFKKGANYQ